MMQSGQMPQMTPMQPPVYVFDPHKLDPRMKRTLVNQTIAGSKIGNYKMHYRCKPVTCSFVSRYEPGHPQKICEVEVVNEHSIDAAEQYSDRGIVRMPTDKLATAVLNVVGREFSGTNFESNKDIRDDLINIRTTFNNTIGTNNPYPIKECECVYAPSVSVIRRQNPMLAGGGFLNYNETFRFSLITTIPVNEPTLLEDEVRMCASDFIKTCNTIECVFRAAIASRNSVLILCPFGHTVDNNPLDDIIKIYNYCIHKYSHLFNKIVIASYFKSCV